MTIHFDVYSLSDLNTTKYGPEHMAGSDALLIAHSSRSGRKPGDLFLVTEQCRQGPFAPQNHPRRYRHTEHGPVEIDSAGEPVSPHQVPLLLAATAPDGPGLEAFAFGRWYPATVEKHTRTRIQVIVTTGTGPRPPKLYKPGAKTLRVRGSVPVEVVA